LAQVALEQQLMATEALMEMLQPLILLPLSVAVLAVPKVADKLLLTTVALAVVLAEMEVLWLLEPLDKVKTVELLQTLAAAAAAVQV
jgi:hypothetical protein